MLTAVALLLVGSVVRYAGAEMAVRGATGVARAAGIPAFVLGALLFGVDLEGVGAALTAAGRGEPALAAGSAFGTVLFLFGAAFGAALLLSRRPVPSPPAPMVAAPAVPVFAAALVVSDRLVARWEGALLVLVYAVYVGFVIRSGRAESEAHEEAAGPKGALAAFAVNGLLLLAAGAYLLVDGGARILDRTTLSAGFVGAAVLGTLASLDEVLLEVLPIRRGAPELATGNLFGTLSGFTAGVPGLAALVRPLAIDAGAAAAFLGVAVVYAIVGTVFLTRDRAGPLLGAAIVGLYGAWLVLAAGV